MAKRRHGHSIPARYSARRAGFTRTSATVLAASTVAFSSQLFGADAVATKDATLEEVIVTGLRGSLHSAQKLKQDAEVVSDSVTAQDIGALPDRSVSEALQRIPGITLQRTNENRDPARLASEGGAVFVRGLSWVRSELNGRDVFSANNGRNLGFEDVSADLLAGVDVYKNASAELIEGGVGGTVNLRTRKPFDQNHRLLAGSIDYNYADLKSQGFMSANALWSDSFTTGGGGRLGALIAVSLGNVGNRTDSIQTGRYDPHNLSAGEATATGLPSGSTVYMPNSYGWRSIDWKQRRTSLATSLQYAPSDKLTFTFEAMLAKADPKDIEHTLGDGSGSGLTLINDTYKFDSRGVLQSGVMQNAQLGTDSRYGESHKWTNDFALNMKWRPTDKFSLSADVQYVKSHADVLSMTAFTQLAQAGALAFNLTGDTPSMMFNQTPNYETDASQYWWAAAMDHIEKNDANSWAQRADGEYTFDDNSWLRSFRFGARATQKEAITRQSGWNWSLLSNQFWGNGGGAPVYLNQGVTPPGAASLYTFNNFFRGSIPVPGVGWFPADGVVSNGTAYAYSILHATETSGWGWAPLSTDFTQAKPGADNPNGGVNDQHEKTQAAYLALRFGHDTPIGEMDGNIGVRAVHTAVDTDRTVRVSGWTNGVSCVPEPGDTLTCPDFLASVAFAADAGTHGLGTDANSYNDFLPSLNIRFKLRDDLQLRFALSKAMVRPTFSQMQSDVLLSYSYGTKTVQIPDPNNPGQTISVTYNTTTGGLVDGTVNGNDHLNGNTGTSGNVHLNPTRATQYDTSLEWYFAPTGSLTFAGFYKDIRDYIFAGTLDEAYTYGGETLHFNVTRNINGAKGKVSGFELAYQQFYDRLPGLWSGLGVQANYTYVNSSGGKNTAVNVFEAPQLNGAADSTLPLEGMSKSSYNFALMYEKAKVSARLAYNWRDRYLLTTSAANIQRPVWSESYGQLDGSVFLSFTDHVKVGVQVVNLLNTRTFLDVGGAVLAPRYSWTDTDRRIAVAMRVSY